MGNILSRRLGFGSLAQRQSRPRVKHGRRMTEEASVLDDVDSVEPKNGTEVPSSTHLVGELVPERYLVLLTEQMTEMLFRLMACDDGSMVMIDGEFDHRTASTPATPMSLSPGSGRVSIQSQSIHQSCMKCKLKMLTIEEFRELRNSFRQVDSDHDNFLTRDEIRTTLNHLFELTENDIEEIISVFDINDDDRISLEEYMEEMKHRLLHEFTREEIKLAFDQADSQQNGYLRVDEVKNAINHLNLHLPNRRIVEIINDCVKNETIDSIDFVLFSTIIKALHRREPITLQKFKPIHHSAVLVTGS